MHIRGVAIALCGLTGLLAVSTANADKKSALSPATIDHMVRATWQQEGITPAPQVDDAQYLRRIYLDITGSIPPPDVVADFLSDKSPDKRARAVDALLDSPKYADHWTDYWDNLLMGRSTKAKQVDRTAFRQWLHKQFEQNTPWNQFVYNLITATGQNSIGGSYAKAQGAGMMMDDSDLAHPEDAAKVNGAVNWFLKYQGKMEDLSGTASKVFLGVQIQCAQCHDHKTEKWKQTDFRSFTANFVNTRPVRVDRAKMVKGIDRIELVDINRPFVPRGKKAGNVADYVAASPAALDGTDFSNAENRRQALASWMTAPENPWFADAIVNRVWAHFMGRGFVEPIDDFRPSNPAVMPDLMKGLSTDFTANNYDLKHLIRTICATQVYQVASSAKATTGLGNLYWASYRLKPMSPEEMIDSLVTATNLNPVLEQVVGANLETIKFQLKRQFEFLFDVDEEFEQKDFEGTIPQALLLLNGGLVNRSVTPIPGTALADVLGMNGSDAQKIEALYMRTLSRKPTDSEVKKWVAFVNTPREVVSEAGGAPGVNRRQARQATMNKQGAKKGNTGYDPLARARGKMGANDQDPKSQAYEDLFWALLNSSEFLFNH